jgi:hypothetical protein
MDTEVLGMFTDADAPHRGDAPHSVPHAFMTIHNYYTSEIILCVCYACGTNSRDTKNVPSEVGTTCFYIML